MIKILEKDLHYINGGLIVAKHHYYSKDTIYEIVPDYSWQQIPYGFSRQFTNYKNALLLANHLGFSTIVKDVIVGKLPKLIGFKRKKKQNQ